MGITNLYPNLPGHLVEFKDGGMSIRATEEGITGKSILILGTATDGIINEPVAVDIATIDQFFGSEVGANGYSNGTTLVKAAKQAYKNGFRDIRCMRVTGSEASAKITKSIPSETIIVDASQVLGEVAGNDELVDYVLEKGPIVASTLDMSIPAVGGGTSAVGYNNLRAYSRKVNIGKNLVSAGATVTAKYQYKEIGVTKKEDVAVTDTGGVFDAIVISDLVYQTASGITQDETNPLLDQYGYSWVDPLTCPVAVEVKTSNTATPGDTLVAGTDFVWDEGMKSITLDSSVSLASGDELTLTYLPYTVESIEETILMKGSVQEFTLENVPVEGSIEMTIGATTVTTDWNIKAGTNNVITLNPMAFRIGDAIKVKYKWEDHIEDTHTMYIESLYGGTVYNEATVAIKEVEKDGESGRVVVLTKPDSKKYTKNEAPLEFSSFDYPTMGIMCMAINAHRLNNVFEAFTENEDSLTKDFPLTSMSLSGGTSGVGVTNNEMFQALSGIRNAEGLLEKRGAYQLLENYSTDYIYVAGVYADMAQTVDKNSNFHHELCMACAVLTYRTNMTHGFMDMKPCQNTRMEGIQDYVAKLLRYDNTNFMQNKEGEVIYDEDNKPMDIGWYTSVVVGPDPVMVSDTMGTYYGSPAIAYAALVASLAPQSAPTNKTLNNVRGLKYTFSNSQLNDLCGNRFVVFKNATNANTATVSTALPRVVDGMTAGAPGCDYARFTTVAVVTDVVDQIREVCDPFIGEPNTIEQRNAMSALVSKRLSKLLTDGEILYYDFNIVATAQMISLGEAQINLTLVVPQELRKIKTVVSLRASA